MGVFDAQIKTPLAVNDPGTDYMLPPPGLLQYGSITALTALTGTNGVDTLHVAGDRDRQMNGNESTRITQDRTHTVGGDQTKHVTGNKTENVIGNFAQTTIGNLGRTIVGATNDLHTGMHTLAHKANQMLDEPIAYFHKIDKKFVVETEHHDQYGFYQLIAANVMNFIDMNNDFKGVQTAVIAAGAEKTVISLADRDAEIADKKLNARFDAIDTKIGAIQPVVYATYLHEVAITQKILVIGVNQYV